MKSKSLTELMAEHITLERESLPMIEEVANRAKQALNLQVDIFTRQFKEQLPKARFSESILLTTFSAREKPTKFPQLIAALEQKQVEVTQIIYDPMNFTFCLYGKVPAL